MINKVDGNNYNTYTKPKKIDIPDGDEKFSLGYQKKESSSGAQDKTGVSEQEKQQSLERSGVRLELSVGGQAAETNRRKQAETAKAQSEEVSVQSPFLEIIRTYIMAAITAVRDFFRSIWNDQPTEGVSSDIQSLDGQPLETVSPDGQPLDGQFLEAVSPDGQPLDGQPLEAASQDGQPLDGQQVEIIPQESRLSDGGPQGMRSGEGTLREPEEILDTSDEASVLALEEERRNREIRQSLRNGDMEHVISLLTDNGRKTIAKNSTLLTSYDKNGRVVEPNASDRERALHGDRNTWTL